MEEFLFGADRKSLNSYRELLHDHRAGKCFYCCKNVARKGELDHFIPWARYPLDLGHNFVYAHKGCNRAKRDHLAAVTHLERWRIQNLDEGHSLSRAFEREGLSSDLERSVLIARWAYEQGFASGARLWIRDSKFEDCDYRWQSALATPSALRLAADATKPRYESWTCRLYLGLSRQGHGQRRVYFVAPPMVFSQGGQHPRRLKVPVPFHGGFTWG